MSRGDGVVRPDLELDPDLQIIDPRTGWERFYDGLEYPWMIRASAVFCTLWVFLFPGAFWLAVMAHGFVWLAVAEKPDVLPIHLPFGAGRPDEHNPLPGAGLRPGKAEGGFYVGQIIGRSNLKGMEVWLGFKSLMQHILLFGTTGAGKTESIVSYLTGCLAIGSGFIFNDAKAAPKAMVQIATILRIFGRDDDMRVINYITGGGARENLDPAARLSNDLAAFAKGSGESITQLLASLMSQSGGDNKIFQERAIALASAVLPALTDLRDQHLLQINPQVIRDHMAFEQVCKLMVRSEISWDSRQALKGYLESLPGFNAEVEAHKQNEQVAVQFGYAQAYFTRTLSSLSDTYGHIYMTGQGEVDWQDAVLHGRCIMTLLPSLEKSGDELANLGKIVLTGVRTSMVVGLGTIFEGSTDDIAYNLPTNTEIPYFVFNDENAYMLTESQDVVNAQARGLGFCVLTGAQDAPGLLENISKTTKQIMANSAIKQIQYLDDKETVELAVSWSGEASVLVKKRYQRFGESGGHHRTRDAEIIERPRLTSTALKALQAGQAYIMYKGKIHYTQIYHHGISENKTPDPKDCWVQNWFPVRMAKVRLPLEEELAALFERSPRDEYRSAMNLVSAEHRAQIERMTRVIHSGNVFEGLGPRSQELVQQVNYQGLALAVYETRDMLTSVSQVEDMLLALLHDDRLEFMQEAAKSATRQRLAQLTMAAAESWDDPFADDPVDVGEESAGGASTGGAGGPALKARAENADTQALLADFLPGYEPGDAGEHADDPFAALPVVQFDEVTQALIDERIATNFDLHAVTLGYGDSAIERAVEENLGLMPWFSRVEDVAEAHRGMVQTEMFVLAVDEATARASADASIQMLVEASRYPKAKPPAASEVDLRSTLAKLIPGIET